MPSFSVSLFNPDELKALEDVLFNAFVRAGRVLAREGHIQGWAPPAERPPPEQVASPTTTEVRPTSEIRPFVPHAPAPPSPETKRQKRRSVKDVLKVVALADKPEGYITIDKARDLIGRDASTQSAISRWVMEKEIPAVIVNGLKPPSKGLPGRVMVNKEALLTRNKERLANVATLPALKRWQTTVDDRERKHEQERAN